MPWAAIAAIASLAGAGATIGNTIYQDVNQPSAPAQPTPAQITTNAVASATQQRQAQADSAAQLLPGLQANTNGGLSPDAYGTLASQFSGDPGGNNPQLQALIAQFLGTSPNSFGGGTPFGSSAPNPSSPGLVGGG